MLNSAMLSHFVCLLRTFSVNISSDTLLVTPLDQHPIYTLFVLKFLIENLSSIADFYCGSFLWIYRCTFKHFQPPHLTHNFTVDHVQCNELQLNAGGYYVGLWSHIIQ